MKRLCPLLLVAAGTSTRIAGGFGTMEAVTRDAIGQSMLVRQTGSPLGTAVFEPRSC
jgi:hypothetical protein